jgi:hypothetical protein
VRRFPDAPKEKLVFTIGSGKLDASITAVSGRERTAAEVQRATTDARDRSRAAAR